jgi:hypothetical protein
LQAKFFYIDPVTGDDPPFKNCPVIALLAHNRSITYGYTGEQTQQQLYCKIDSGSVIVDPWRKFPLNNTNFEVIHYGNTRII